MSPVSALAAFNNSGTQATAATTSISGDDVMSAFWGVNDTHRFLLFGSSINDIPTTGGSGATFGGNHIFTVNNDLDALGDLYFTVQMTMPTVVVTIARTASAGDFYGDVSRTDISFTSFTDAEQGKPFGGALYELDADEDGLYPPVGESGDYESTDAYSSKYLAQFKDGEMVVVGEGDDARVGRIEGRRGGYCTAESKKCRADGLPAHVDTSDQFYTVGIYTKNEPILDANGQPTLDTNGNVNMQPVFSHQIDADRWTVRRLLGTANSIAGGFFEAVGGLTVGGIKSGGRGQAIFASTAAGGKDSDHEYVYGAGLTAAVQKPSAGVGVLGRWTEFGLAKFIRRIEFMVGTQVWQTMEQNDLLNCLNAESYESAYTNVGFQTNGGTTTEGNMSYERDVGPVYSGAQYQASFKLPLLTKTLGPNLNKFVNQTEDGYLMAAAPHQTVKIRISYATSPVDMIQGATSIIYPVDVKTAPLPGGLTPAVAAVMPVTNLPVSIVGPPDLNKTLASEIKSISTQLFGKHQVMCNAERQQLRNMAQGLPKRIKMTQNATSSLTTVTEKTLYTVDLDHFSLFASALVVNVQGLDKKIVKAFQQTGFESQNYESKNNRLHNSIHGIDQFGMATPKYRPVEIQGAIRSAELILNSSSISGVLPGYFLTSSAADSMGLFSNYYFTGGKQRAPGSGYSVFPLASHAYDASAVPLNRFDNIRLRLAVTQGGTNVITTVTCLGETTALYKGGAASLAMY